VSRAKRYSGQPLYVTCVDPSSRVIVASAPINPLGPVGGGEVMVEGGHGVAQAPVQALLPELA
jgi:hypothetical protein